MTMKASVVVPTCGRENRLRDLLSSLKQQTAERDEFEVVLVDNSPGGLDGLRIRKLAEGLQFEFLRESRTGAAYARNLGIEKAENDIVIFLDDDMTVEPDFIKEHLRAHEKEERAVCVLGEIRQTPAIPGKLISKYVSRSVPLNFRLGDVSVSEVDYGCFYTANISVPRSELERVGGFDEGFPCYGWEDIELGFKLQQRHIPIIYEPKAVGYHHFDASLGGYLRKRYASGKSLGYFLFKHPELREEFHIANISFPTILAKAAAAVLIFLPAVLLFRLTETPMYRVFDAVGNFALYLGLKSSGKC